MGQPLGTVKTWVRAALKNFARRTGRRRCRHELQRTARTLRTVRDGPGRRAGAQRDPRAPEAAVRGLYGRNQTGARNDGAAGRHGHPGGAIAGTAPPHTGESAGGNSAASAGRRSWPSPSGSRCSPRFTSAAASATSANELARLRETIATRPWSWRASTRPSPLSTGGHGGHHVRRGKADAQRQGLRQSDAGRAADRRQSAAGSRGQGVRDVGHQRRQGAGRRGCSRRRPMAAPCTFNAAPRRTPRPSR